MFIPSVFTEYLVYIVTVHVFSSEGFLPGLMYVSQDGSHCIYLEQEIP